MNRSEISPWTVPRTGAAYDRGVTVVIVWGTDDHQRMCGPRHFSRKLSEVVYIFEFLRFRVLRLLAGKMQSQCQCSGLVNVNVRRGKIERSHSSQDEAITCSAGTIVASSCIEGRMAGSTNSSPSNTRHRTAGGRVLLGELFVEPALRRNAHAVVEGLGRAVRPAGPAGTLGGRRVVPLFSCNVILFL